MQRTSMRTIEYRMTCILDGLAFPAARWQLIAPAEYYGADALTTASLHTLPMRPYRNVADVVQAIVDGPVGETAVLRVAPGPTADAGQPRPSHLLGPVAAQHGRPAAMPSAASA